MIKQPGIRHGVALVTLITLWTVLLAQHSLAATDTGELRGLWVDGWNAGFKNPRETSQLVSDCRKYNFNAIFVQMRRRADALYLPHAPNTDVRAGGMPPQYDALVDLITQCHKGKPRIQVHCWMVANLVWSGDPRSAPSNHVVKVHPEYLSRTAAGTTVIAEGCFLDPGHPEAMRLVHHAALDVARRYEVDGLHWDYIRYPQLDSGYNETAIRRFNAEYGLPGKPAPSDPRFSAWRRRQITDFLGWVNADVWQVNPKLQISAAVFANHKDAVTNRLQDWGAWLQEGLLDFCVPMNYSADTAKGFSPKVLEARNHAGIRRIYMGQGGYMNTPAATVAQLQDARSQKFQGTVLFSYGKPSSGASPPAALAFIKQKFQPTWKNPPELPWRTRPAKGIIKGQILRQSDHSPVAGANVAIHTPAGRALKAESHGAYAFFEVPPGKYILSATAPGMSGSSGSVEVRAGVVTALDLSLADGRPAAKPK